MPGEELLEEQRENQVVQGPPPAPIAAGNGGGGAGAEAIRPLQNENENENENDGNNVHANEVDNDNHVEPPPGPNPPGAGVGGGQIAQNADPQNHNGREDDGDGIEQDGDDNGDNNHIERPPGPNPPQPAPPDPVPGPGAGGENRNGQNNNQQENPQPVQERINMDMAHAVMRAGGARRMWKDHGERGISFHTMKELLQMEERHKEKEKDKKDGNKKDKKRDINTQNGLVSGLLHMRDSNIYKAVVLARELEGGGNNPLRSGRFQRFFKSSKYNKAADSLKIIGAANGALGTLDAVVGEGTYRDSVIGKGIGLISDFMALVTSIREFVIKIKNYKKGKTRTDKAFTVIGMLTDIFTVLAKGCSMAKTIAGFAGKKDGIFDNGALWDRITLLMNSASQIGGFLGAARGLHVTRAGISKLKVLENMRWKGGNGGEGIQAIVEKYEQPQEAQGEENGDHADAGENEDGQTENGIQGNEDEHNEDGRDEDVQDENRAQVPAEQHHEDGGNHVNDANPNPNPQPAPGGAGAGEEAPHRRRKLRLRIRRKNRNAQEAGQAPQAGAGKKQKPQTATKTERAERRVAANKLLNKEEVSSEEKDRLASYVAIHRRIDRTKRSLATTSTGLIAAAIGLGSSIAISVNNNTGSDSSKTAKTWMGFAASLGGVGATGTKMGIEKRNQEKQDSDEADAVQARLWGTIEELKDDKYGLRGAVKKADTATEEAELEEPRAVYKRYVAAQSQFEDSGVNYAQLFQAPDLRSFKKMLISGI